MNTVLITGSSRGLGKALAFEFARNRYDIIIHGRDGEQLRSIHDDIEKLQVDCEIVTGDITDANTRTMLICAARKMKVDVLINNAGLYLQKSVLNSEYEDIKKLVNTNLVVPILLTKTICSVFKENKKGHIININSTAGKRPNEQEQVYCSTKYGLRGFSDSFKQEAIKYGINVTDVYLGAMQTNMTFNREGKEKLIQPAEAARVICMIAQNYTSLRVSEIEILRKLY